MDYTHLYIFNRFNIFVSLLCVNFAKASLVSQMVKNLPAMQSSIPGSGRSPGGGHGNPLQNSCLENSMDRGAWQATYSSWGCKELNMTEPLHFIVHLHDFIFTAYTFLEFLKPLSDLALQRSMPNCPFIAKGEGNVLPTVVISYPYSSKPQRWPLRVTVPLN